MLSIVTRTLVLLAITILPVGPGVAQQNLVRTAFDIAALPDLTGQVILSVSGLDDSRFEGGVFKLDIGRLQALGTVDVETSSIWTQGVHRYTGTRLSDLLAALGITDPQLQLNFLALNDYQVDFAVGEVTEEAPILAFLQDGLPMPVRDKGPVWMIYPYDSGVEYRTDTVFFRSIWQLDRIEVLR